MAELHPNADYQGFLSKGKFMIQRGHSSGKYHFYPRVIEPGTGNDDLEWIEASGKGVIHSTTTVRVRPPAEPYNVVLVELDEGPRMMSRVEGVDPLRVKIGMRVQARIAHQNEEYFVVFDPE